MELIFQNHKVGGIKWDLDHLFEFFHEQDAFYDLNYGTFSFTKKNNDSYVQLGFSCAEVKALDHALNMSYSCFCYHVAALGVCVVGTRGYHESLILFAGLLL